MATPIPPRASEVKEYIEGELTYKGRVFKDEVCRVFVLPDRVVDLLFQEMKLVKVEPNIYTREGASLADLYSGRASRGLQFPQFQGVSSPSTVSPLIFQESQSLRDMFSQLEEVDATFPNSRPAAKPRKPRIEAKPIKIPMDTVVLGDDKKEQILAAISQIKNRDLIFNKWGFSEVFEKGTAVSLLFHGLPGTGKTLMAQAIADDLAMELKVYGTAEIESSEPGGAERAMKTIFKEATDLIDKGGKQRVILFDECDSLLSSRENMGTILAAQVNTLLSEIEHFAGVIIFTTNRLGRLDPALERRIAAKIEFPFPDDKQREQIWLRLIPKKAPIGDDVSFEKLSQFPIAGGNIKNVVLNAARHAAYEKSKTIQTTHFKKALTKELESVEQFTDAYNDDHGHRSRERESVEMGSEMGVNKIRKAGTDVAKRPRK